MKKVVSVLLACVLTTVLALVLTSCGNDSENGGNNSGGSGGNTASGGNNQNEPGSNQGGANVAVPNPANLPVNPASDFEHAQTDGGVVIRRYIGTSNTVRIPAEISGSPVVSIGESAFSDMGLIAVYIPQSVTHIGNSAFYGNTELAAVTIPDGVTELTHTVFNRCGSLPAETRLQIQRLIHHRMEIVEFGGYHWLVLAEEGDKKFFLTVDIIMERTYHNLYRSVTWETSEIREFLNSEFYYSFSEEDRAKIVQTEVTNNRTARDGEDTTDYIFLLSYDDETRLIRGGQAARIASGPSGEAQRWLLRSSGTTSNTSLYVSETGHIHILGTRVDNRWGVRPAMWVRF
jgi:hypothetical protein